MRRDGVSAVRRADLRTKSAEDGDSHSVRQTVEGREGFRLEGSSPELAAEGIEEETERPLSTGELDVVQPTASEAEMDAFDGFDAEDESKTESFGAFDEANLSDEQIRTPEEAHEIGAKTQSISTPDDDEFSFDDEIEPPKKKKK
jgi:hypothetical protein